MQKPNALLLVLAVVVLALLLPHGTIPFLVGVAWKISKIILILLAIIIIIAYFRKRKTA